MRLQDRPRFRASATARFLSFEQGANAARALAQSGPAPGELPAARRDRGRAHRRPTTAATRCCSSRSSRPTTRSTRGSRGRSSASATTTAPCATTRSASANDEPHGGERDDARGQLAQRVPARAVHARRDRRTRRDQRDVRDRVHVGPFHRPARGGDGAVLDTAAAGRRVAGRRHLPLHPRLPRRPRAVLHRARARHRRRAAASSGPRSSRPRPTRCLRNGGTITHHHAVGRDHRPWYDRQRPEPFAGALRAAKAALDPASILNPGVLVDP